MGKKSVIQFFGYLCIRVCTAPFVLLSYKSIHAIGNCLGRAAFYLLSKQRKRTLSNLSLASSLHLSSAELKKTAKESLGSLLITCLEYVKLAKEKNIKNIAECVNPEEAARIIAGGQGVIFFCGHQANWEILFLEGTSRMPGVAIGQPVKNGYLYDWVLRMRQKFGGKIVTPKEAVKEGLRALKQGKFLGIVGDQGMPEGGFRSPFLGRSALTSPLPALLSYRSGCPIIVATTLRVEGRYFITYSHPIYPDKSRTSEEEIPRLMKEALSIFESAILQTPGQWLWQHNRWKQQILGRVKKPYRQEAIAVMADKKGWDLLLPHIKTFREIYPTEFFTFYIPFEVSSAPCKELDAEVIPYVSYQEIKTEDFRFKLVFNFTDDPSLSSHFLKLSAFQALNVSDLAKLSKLSLQASLSDLLKGALLNAL